MEREFKNTQYARKEFDIKGRFRIVPLNFGEYEGEKIFDFEEVGIQTKDMPFEDYSISPWLCPND